VVTCDFLLVFHYNYVCDVLYRFWYIITYLQFYFRNSDASHVPKSKSSPSWPIPTHFQTFTY